MDDWDLGGIFKELWANQDDIVNIGVEANNNDNQEHDLINVGEEEDYFNNHEGDMLHVSENHDDDFITLGEESIPVNDTRDDELLYIGDTINVNNMDTHGDEFRSSGKETDDHILRGEDSLSSSDFFKDDPMVPIFESISRQWLQRR